MATITKRELVNMVCAQLDNGCTQADVLEIVQKMVDSITEAVGNGDTVVFRNFGTFCPKEVKAKVGRNPKDPGKDVAIPARTVVKFKVGKNLKEIVAKLSK
ncbi:MAG: integration host factor subunit beta [Akkermansia sp.]|nr:integration host factor subunit beta [Akkermansia sp.]